MMSYREIFKLSISPFSKREKFRLMFISIVQIALGFLDLVGILFLGVLGSLSISGIQSTNPGTQIERVLRITHLDGMSFQNQVAYLALLAAAILCLKTFASLLFTRSNLIFLSRKSSDISILLFKKHLEQPLDLMREKNSQETLYYVTHGVTRVTIGIVGSIISLVSDISLLMILFVGLFFVNATTAIATAGFFIIVALVMHFSIARKIHDIAEDVARTSVNLNEKIIETITFYRELLVRSRRNYYLENVSKLRQQLALSESQINFYPNINKYVMDLIIVLGVLIISAIQFATTDAKNSAASIVIFLVSGTRMGPAILRIQQTLSAVTSNAGSSEETLKEIRKIQFENKSYFISQRVKETDFTHLDFKPKIAIDDLCFKYPGTEKLAVDHVSLEIKEGQFVAIVGASGAGKTTLVDLILGVYTPFQGLITISDSSVPEVFDQHPGAVGYVPQNTKVSNSSIAENIALGFDANSHETHMSAAFSMVGLLDLVESLPSKENAQVGENGHKFSGGQIQRLGIARALFTNPKLIFLDEATSSLDAISEKAITDSLRALKGKVTVVTIAHRLSTVKEADLVIFMENGRVAAQGTFEEVKVISENFRNQAKLLGL